MEEKGLILNSYDPEGNLKMTINSHLTADGYPIISPTLETAKGMYPKKEQFRNTVSSGQINMFDVEVTTEREICGGEYWAIVNNRNDVHIDDFVEFSIIDKNDVLGYFVYYGLTVGVDILELSKFILSDYIKKGWNGYEYYTQCFEMIKGTSGVVPGLFYRAQVESFGTIDYNFWWRIYFYE